MARAEHQFDVLVYNDTWMFRIELEDENGYEGYEYDPNDWFNCPIDILYHGTTEREEFLDSLN